MQKLLIILVVAAFALLAVSVLIPSRHTLSVSSGALSLLVASNTALVSLDRPAALLAPIRLRQPVESESPSPGVYKATRDTMVVVVPRSVDEQMVVGVGDLSRFKMPCSKPESGLEPMDSPPLNIAGLSKK